MTFYWTPGTKGLNFTSLTKKQKKSSKANIWAITNEILRIFKWVKVLKNGPGKICGRQPLKKLK